MKNILIHHRKFLIIPILIFLLAVAVFIILNKHETKVPERALFVQAGCLCHGIIDN